MVEALVVAGCVLLLAACERQQQPANGETAQVAAAKAAVGHKLNTPESVEFRNVIEYRDGVVCGEFNAKKMFSGTDIGFRKFIYNAPEPGVLAIDSGDLSREDTNYWCSEQPDKRLRMLAASVAELTQACQAAGGKSSDINCRLAATQKSTLEALGPGTGSKVATAAAAPAAQASAPDSAVPAAAAPAATSSQPGPSGNPDAAILAQVEGALQAWRARWEAGDVDGYLRMYEASFTGGAGSRAQWERQRREKMANVRPSIRVERLQAVRTTPNEVELRFVQVYAARQHQDRGTKTMVFRRAPSGWLIADERWSAAS